MYEGEYYNLNKELVTYNDCGFQNLQPLHKLVVDMDFDVMSTRQVFLCCLGPHCDKTVSENGFLGERKGLVEDCQFQYTTPQFYAPGHRTQRTVQLHKLLPCACMVSHILASQVPHQVLTGLLPLSCSLSFADICVKGLRGDSQVCLRSCSALYKCRNADECALDSLSSLQQRMLSSHSLGHRLWLCWPGSWPWWYVRCQPVALQ